MGRREQREQIFKLLFCVEFHKSDDLREQETLYFDRLATCPIEEELKVTQKDTEYISDKYEKIQSKISEIDQMINEKVEGWDTTRMGKVEVTVLRLALYELLFDDDIPNNVAINEAIELAKKFGQENAGGFVNAVLSKFLPEKKEEK